MAGVKPLQRYPHLKDAYGWCSRLYYNEIL